MTDGRVVDELCAAGLGRRDPVALALAPGVGLGMAAAGGTLSWSWGAEDIPVVVGLVEDALRPRWVWWSNETAVPLIRAGVRVATCWDIAAVHRLLFGGWRADPARVWAHLHALALETMPTLAPPDLFSYAGDDGDGEDPVRPDGYLRPEWAGGAWARTSVRARRWAELASRVAGLQQASLAQLSDRPKAGALARSESTAELLCAELSADGLPMDRAVALEILARVVGPRPRTGTEEAELRAERDAEVLRHALAPAQVDLRSPAQVRSMLSRTGFDLPDTRAWRLRALAGTHPLVDALLTWRKAERMSTTYGYTWLDEHLGDDGRLRGSWTGSDGAAGRMTASAGLHNMPAEMRPAVAAEAGHILVRGRLGPGRASGAGRRVSGTRCWPGPRSTMTCTLRWPSSSNWTGRPPRWPSSGLCTARRRETGPEHCAASKRLTPWRWLTWRTLIGRARPGGTCAPTAGAWSR